jgi:hypothetical protein
VVYIPLNVSFKLEAISNPPDATGVEIQNQWSHHPYCPINYDIGDSSAQGFLYRYFKNLGGH